MPRTPAMALMSTRAKVATATRTILDISPMPKISMAKGRMAILGNAYTAETMGSRMARSVRDIPMSRPTTTPGSAPRKNPQKMRHRTSSRTRGATTDRT